ncbi:MAG: formylglycine-generating enzyme family protein [Deltaproteobacteria bacterium]|jgi:formylglycine-generating enzyme required for sulfatase activity|nr:formylglycine-generating enzyme family protein [Deltaproteobacteria bacterium]
MKKINRARPSAAHVFLLAVLATAVLSLAPPLAPDAPADSPQVYSNSVGMQFVQIPAGSFVMGGGKYPDEMLAHEVDIPRTFYLGRFEVTRGQWARVMENSPDSHEDSILPVSDISYDEMQDFIARLNQSEGHDGYRLPTEAEWEYACRAGSTTKYPFGDDPDGLGQFAWHKGNSDGQAHFAGQKKPNAWGLYDMIGNVSEQVSDYYGKFYYFVSPSVAPAGPVVGYGRAHRGGDYASQNEASPTYRSYGEKEKVVGFRLVWSPEE